LTSLGSACTHKPLTEIRGNQEFQRNVVYANRDLRIAGRRYANRDFLYTNPGDRGRAVHESNDRVHKSFDQIDPGGSFGGRSCCVQVCPRASRFAYMYSDEKGAGPQKVQVLRTWPPERCAVCAPVGHDHGSMAVTDAIPSCATAVVTLSSPLRTDGVAMVTFRNFCDAAKKFSPKQHRTRVDGEMTDKPCPLHDQRRKRSCKQADNPNDLCPHFDSGRAFSRCAHLLICYCPDVERTQRLLLCTIRRSGAGRSASTPPPPRRDGVGASPSCPGFSCLSGRGEGSNPSPPRGPPSWGSNLFGIFDASIAGVPHSYPFSHPISFLPPFPPPSLPHPSPIPPLPSLHHPPLTPATAPHLSPH